jgi:MarR family transcriptional regulator, transcriptional regulator for hemolysin
MDLSFQPLGRAIGRTHKLVRAWGDRALAPIGASVTDFILLFHIAAAPAPGMSQTAIARYSDMGGPALVRHLDRLEREGIVRRTRDDVDRRVMRVTLTPAGEARLDEIAAVMARSDAQLRGLLTDEEQRVLQGALDKLFDFSRNELEGIPNAPSALSDAHVSNAQGGTA